MPDPNPAAGSTPTSLTTSPGSTTSSASSEGSGAAASGSVPNIDTGSGEGSTPSSPSSSPPSIEAFDFDALFGGTEDPAPSSPPTPEVQPVTPAVQPVPPVGVEPTVSAPATPPQQSAPQPPVSEGTGVQAPQAGATPPSPSLDFSEPAAIAQRLLSDRATVEAHVAQQLFTLTPEEIEALETDVVGTIPKLLAKAYIAAQAATLTQLQQIVPSMMQKQTTQTKRYEANSAKFFSAWPQLNPETHGDLVYRYGVVYRQMNPQASLDQMIKDLGPLVLHAAGLPLAPTAPAKSKHPAAFMPAPNGGPAGVTSQPSAEPYGFLGLTD